MILGSSISAVPSFPGLRRFPDGRRFKQWTGDDSKALMKVRHLFFFRYAKLTYNQVYLPALLGYVPSEMLRCFSAFLDFCYLVRRSVINDSTLAEIDDALLRFHQSRTIFQTSGARPEGFSLP